MNQGVNIINITKRFGRFYAVNNVSLSVDAGKILGLFGANGAGKTTLIRMIGGLIKPTSGECIIADGAKKGDKLSKIGYMSQSFSLIEELTMEENLSFYGTLYGMKSSAVQAASQKYTDYFGLDKFHKSLVSRLPTGLRQLLAFSVSMMHEPAILLLDEPTSGLDAVNRRKMWDAIYMAALSGTAVIVSTHYLDEAFYCNEIALMEHGVVKVHGNPEELAKNVPNGKLIYYFTQHN